MNAINDMIIEGINYKDCGDFIDGEAPGHKRGCGCSSEKYNPKDNSFIKKTKTLFRSNMKQR